MTSLQKVIKYLAIAFAIFLTVSIIGGILGATGLIGEFISSDAVLDNTKVYSVSQDVKTLKIDINAADFKITEGDEFAIESNLKNLTVKEQGGCLTVTEDKNFGTNYRNAVLVMYIPENFVFETAKIKTGAGKLTVDALSAEELSLNLGAGKVKISELNAYEECEIDGGAGEITISGGVINNLDFDMGVGAVNLTTALYGNSDVECGVGETDIKLLGEKEDYKISVDKGIGDTKIDGQSVADGSTYGDGKYKIKLDSGVGAVNIYFNEAKEVF